jgi:hypothetical protein
MSNKKAAQKTASKIRAYAIELLNTDLESALVVANCYGEFLRINHIGVFADVEFEDYFSRRFSFLLDGKSKKDESETLHLITTSLPYGGHTRVVERLFKGGLGNALATLDNLPKEVSEKIPCDIVVYENVRQYSGVDTIQNILEIGLKFKTVILHIHPDDIYSAVAAALFSKLGIKVYFYNHSDHSFSFGYFAAEKILEISKYGWVKGVTRGIEHKQTFVGIPIPILAYKTKHDANEINIKGFFSGSAGKFYPWREYNAVNFLNLFFQIPSNSAKVKFYICGPNGQEKIWRNLDDNARINIEFLGKRNHSEYMALLSSCDFYLDSFPQGNGTGFVESVMLGMPTFGMDLLAGCSYADILKSHTLLELIRDITKFVGDPNLSQYYSNVRLELIQEQSTEVCVNRVKAIMTGEENIPIPIILQNMECLENFWELYWEDNNRILLHTDMLAKLSVLQKLRFLKCWSDVWPFFSTLSILKMLVRKITSRLAKSFLKFAYAK